MAIGELQAQCPGTQTSTGIAGIGDGAGTGAKATGGMSFCSTTTVSWVTTFLLTALFVLDLFTHNRPLLAWNAVGGGWNAGCKHRSGNEQRGKPDHDGNSGSYEFGGYTHIIRLRVVVRQ